MARASEPRFVFLQRVPVKMTFFDVGCSEKGLKNQRILFNKGQIVAEKDFRAIKPIQKIPRQSLSTIGKKKWLTFWQKELLSRIGLDERLLYGPCFSGNEDGQKKIMTIFTLFVLL